MKLASVLLFSALTTAVSAIHPHSNIGTKLLSQARRVEDVEGGEEEAQEEKGENADSDVSWMPNYSIQFDSCHNVRNYNMNEYGDVTSTNLVKFKIVASNKCGSRSKGAAEYLVDMGTFVNAYTEWQMNEREYKCEQVRESCYCDESDDKESCEASCYTSAGLSYCVEQQQDDKTFDFNLQEYLECTPLENENYPQYDSYGAVIQFYVGPKCGKRGEKINLAVYTDEYCSQEYDDSIFAKITGMSLPYQSASMVSEACISCNKNRANNDGYYANPEVTEICEETYTYATKCETNLAGSIYYPDTSGCDYVTNIRSYEVGYTPRSGGAIVFFAVLFGLATAFLAYQTYKMRQRAPGGSRSIALNSDAAVV